MTRDKKRKTGNKDGIAKNSTNTKFIFHTREQHQLLIVFVPFVAIHFLGMGNSICSIVVVLELVGDDKNSGGSVWVFGTYEIRFFLFNPQN